MKKTLIKLCSVAAIGLALTACNNDAANKQAQDADNAAIDQLVQDKVKTLDDSLTKACEDKVSLAAEEKLKSEPAPKGAKPVAHHTTPSKPNTPPKKDEPKPAPANSKASKMGGTDATGGAANNKASKMGGTDATGGASNNKASKMGGTK